MVDDGMRTIDWWSNGLSETFVTRLTAVSGGASVTNSNLCAYATSDRPYFSGPRMQTTLGDMPISEGGTIAVMGGSLLMTERSVASYCPYLHHGQDLTVMQIYIGSRTGTGTADGLSHTQIPGRVGRFHRPDRSDWIALYSAIERWRHLPDDWDGEDGSRPTNNTLEAVLAFLSSAEAAHAPAPRAFIAGDGECGFRWRKEDGFASVAWLPEGEVVAYLRASGDTDPYRLEQPTNPMPDMSEFLTRLRANF